MKVILEEPQIPEDYLALEVTGRACSAGTPGGSLSCLEWSVATGTSPKSGTRSRCLYMVGVGMNDL